MMLGEVQTNWIIVFVSTLSICSASSEQQVGANAGKTPDVTGDVPKGHLLPFGEHRPSEGSIKTIDGFVDPITFREKYYDQVPVLFKNAAKDSPGFQKWSDDYLREKYGKILVDTEIAKKENRTKGLKQMELASFLDSYISEDIYMVQDAAEEMRGEISLPKPIICGGHQKKMATAIIWFSSGGTKSVLHNDDIENINCLYDGSKRFQMIDRKYRDEIEGQLFVFRRGYSKVDVDKVDMHKFPGLRDLPWYDVHMEKGDCLYIPSRWYHIVHSAGPRNLAVNAWFRPVKNFDYKDCERYNGEYPDHTPMIGLKFLGMEGLLADPNEEGSPGDTPVEQYTYGPEEVIKPEELFWDFLGWESITLEDFKAVYMQDASLDEIYMAFLSIDKDGDRVITWDELRVPAEELVMLAETYPFLVPLQNHHPLDMVDTGNSDNQADTDGHSGTKDEL